MNYLPLFSTLMTAIFAGAVLNRYRVKRGTYLLLWGFGLVLYGLGTFGELYLSLFYSEFILKLWYLSGAMLTAAWLGQGTIHLLVRKRNVAPTLTGILAVVSVIAAVLVFIAPVTEAAASYNIADPVSSQYRDIIVRSGAIITLTILLNVYGTLGLVGGALYSAFIFWRKRVLFDRMVGNVLIAAGALLPALGGSFIKAGLADWLYFSELLGAILMFLGFLRATSGKPVSVPGPATAAPGN
jgi:hypothetical protein